MNMDQESIQNFIREEAAKLRVGSGELLELNHRLNCLESKFNSNSEKKQETICFQASIIKELESENDILRFSLLSTRDFLEESLPKFFDLPNLHKEERTEIKAIILEEFNFIKEKISVLTSKATKYSLENNCNTSPNIKRGNEDSKEEDEERKSNEESILTSQQNERNSCYSMNENQSGTNLEDPAYFPAVGGSSPSNKERQNNRSQLETVNEEKDEDDFPSFFNLIKSPYIALKQLQQDYTTQLQKQMKLTQEVAQLKDLLFESEQKCKALQSLSEQLLCLVEDTNSQKQNIVGDVTSETISQFEEDYRGIIEEFKSLKSELASLNLENQSKICQKFNEMEGHLKQINKRMDQYLDVENQKDSNQNNLESLPEESIDDVIALNQELTQKRVEIQLLTSASHRIYADLALVTAQLNNHQQVLKQAQIEINQKNEENSRLNSQLNEKISEQRFIENEYLKTINQFKQIQVQLNDIITKSNSEIFLLNQKNRIEKENHKKEIVILSNERDQFEKMLAQKDDIIKQQNSRINKGFDTTRQNQTPKNISADLIEISSRLAECNYLVSELISELQNEQTKSVNLRKLLDQIQHASNPFRPLSSGLRLATFEDMNGNSQQQPTSSANPIDDNQRK